MHKIEWMLYYSKNLRFPLLLIVFLFVFQMILGLSVVGFQKYLIDSVFVYGNYHYLFYFILGLSALIIINNTAYLIAVHYKRKVEAGVQVDITRQTYQSLYRTPILSYRKKKIGDYVKRVTEDAGNVAYTITNDIPSIIQEVVTVIIVSIILLAISPSFFLILFTISTLYTLLGKYFAPKIKDISKEVSSYRAEHLASVEENISGLKEIVIFNKEEAVKENQRKFHNGIIELSIKEINLLNKGVFTSKLLRTIITVFIIGYGGYSIIQDSITLGTFVVLFQFSFDFVDGSNKLYNLVIGIAGSKASFERIRELQHKEDEGEKVPLTNSVQSLVMEDVEFSYEEHAKPVLYNFSIAVPIGKKVALVSRSGEGKSTIAYLFARLYKPSKGMISVNGKDIRELGTDNWSSKIGMVAQEPYLFNDTIKNNLLLGNEIPSEHLDFICEGLLLKELINALPGGYDAVIGGNGVQLSGGEMQRIALARALIKKPEVLVLDEATSALDVDTEQTVQNFIDQVRAGMTTIIIAHRLSTIINSDMIYVLKDGQVIEKGAHFELINNNGEYKTMQTTDSMEGKNVTDN